MPTFSGSLWSNSRDSKFRLLIRELQEASWDKLYEANISAGKAFDIFHSIIMDTFDRCCPETIKIINNKNKYKKWYNNELKNIKQQLETVYTIFKVTQSEHVKHKYVQLKTDYKKKILDAKIDYHSKKRGLKQTKGYLGHH